jgi:hypothetical protein
MTTDDSEAFVNQGNLESAFADKLDVPLPDLYPGLNEVDLLRTAWAALIEAEAIVVDPSKLTSGRLAVDARAGLIVTVSFELDRRVTVTDQGDIDAIDALTLKTAAELLAQALYSRYMSPTHKPKFTGRRGENS